MILLQKLKISFSMLLLIILPTITACGDSEGDKSTLPIKPTNSSTAEPAGNVRLTIGVITDKTGPAAPAYIDMDMALADMVKYYNENHLIPGIEMKIITYDGQFDTSRDVPGYNWLKEQGADLIFSSVEHTPIILKPVVDQDRTILFTGIALEEILDPPGYVFALANKQDDSFYTFLKWVAENDWDHQINGPARIGLTNWNIPLDVTIADAIEKYCDEHPEQFQWIGAFFTDFKFSWQTEVEALKDCDYLMPPSTLMAGFAKEYRKAGYGAKFLGYDAHLAYFGNIETFGAWNEVDESLFYRSAKYWNEEGPIINLAKQILHDYHPDEAEKIIGSGIGYTAAATYYQMFEIIASAVEQVGAGNLDSEAMYKAAQNYSLTLEGLDDYATLGANKRTSNNYIAIYELDADQKDIFRVDPEIWLPIVDLD